MKKQVKMIRKCFYIEPSQAKKLKKKSTKKLSESQIIRDLINTLN